VLGSCCAVPHANMTTTTSVCIEHASAAACSSLAPHSFASTSFSAGTMCATPGTCESAVLQTNCCQLDDDACTSTLATTLDCTGFGVAGTGSCSPTSGVCV
jgi:hypothetical protein